MDQGREKWLLTSRWMLWLAPAGLRGGLKLEAYHQSRQPHSFFLCGPRCSGTSDRCSGRCGVISYALLRQPYLRPRRCGDLGFVSRQKPAEHHTPDVPAAPDVEASCITSCRGRRVSFFPLSLSHPPCYRWCQALRRRKAACTFPCLFLYQTLRRHSMSAVAAQLPCPPLFLPSGVVLPPRLAHAHGHSTLMFSASQMLSNIGIRHG